MHGGAFDEPAGDYVAFTTAEGRMRGTATAVSIGTTESLDLVAGALGLVEVDIGELRGGVRGGVPAKASFMSAAGSPDSAAGACTSS